MLIIVSHNILFCSKWPINVFLYFGLKTGKIEVVANHVMHLLWKFEWNMLKNDRIIAKMPGTFKSTSLLLQHVQ